MSRPVSIRTPLVLGALSLAAFFAASAAAARRDEPLRGNAEEQQARSEPVANADELFDSGDEDAYVIPGAYVVDFKDGVDEGWIRSEAETLGVTFRPTVLE